MQIPLDYYTILGVPNEVTSEQLTQAYEDRCLQIPRREYSDDMIAARRQLLNQAYEILSNSDKREEYDKELFGNFDQATEELPKILLPPIPTKESADNTHIIQDGLEITEEQLPGALLLLEELGKYHDIIRLSKKGMALLDAATPSIQADLILSFANASLEMSLEQGQQEHWEEAAEVANQGLEQLKQSQLFPQLQEELISALNKLRPYRILALVSLELTDSQQRQRGIELLEQMIQDRHGIDGQVTDKSELGIDDFLRFIQQIRLYLTAQEQQTLFEAEAKRPSITGIYLTAYVLLAKGFAEKRPSLIVQAKRWLEQLSRYQAINIEQAVCALLLSQTEEANQILEQTPPDEALNTIQEKSDGSPDLIPGLCWYTTHWLQTEVLTHFRDLSSHSVSLNDYFADENVQSYLDGLFWETQVAQRTKPHIDTDLDPEEQTMPLAREQLVDQRFIRPRKRRKRQKTTTNQSAYSDLPMFAGVNTGAATAAISAPAVSRSSRREFSKRFRQSNNSHYSQTGAIALPGQLDEAIRDNSSPNSTPPKHRHHSPTYHRSSLNQSGTHWSINWSRMLPSIALLLGILTGASWLLKSQVFYSPLSALTGEQLQVSLNQPLMKLPSAETQTLSSNVFTETEATSIIELWLSKKADAFGKEHKVNALNDVLTGYILNNWKNHAENLKNNAIYRQYKHEVSVQSVKPLGKDQMQIEAIVKEGTHHYQGSQLAKQEQDNLRVLYTLVKKNQEQWKIKDIAVLR